MSKNKIIIGILVVIVLGILLFPIKGYLKDGGTIQYKAIVYNIEKVYRISEDDGYEEGLIVNILGIEVLNTVQ